MTDFPKLVAALADAGVRFIIVGGAAATAHGSARLTFDLDVVYARDDENIRRLAEALTPYHPTLRGAPERLPFTFDTEAIRRGLNFTLSTSLGALDLLGELAGGGTFTSLSPRTITITLLGRKCQVLDLDALIEVKRAAGRPKDLDTVAELEALRDESGTPGA